MPILSEKCPGTTSIENANFFEFEHRSHCLDVDSFSIRDLKVEAKIEPDSENTPLTPRNVYNHHVEDSNSQKRPSPNLISARQKRRAEMFPQSQRRCLILTMNCETRRTWVTSRGKYSTAPLHQFRESMLFCSRQIFLAI